MPKINFLCIYGCSNSIIYVGFTGRYEVQHGATGPGCVFLDLGAPANHGTKKVGGGFCIVICGQYIDHAAQLLRIVGRRESNMVGLRYFGINKRTLIPLEIVLFRAACYAGLLFGLQ